MTTVARVYSDVVMSLGSEVCEELLEFQKVFRKEDMDFFNSSLIAFEKKREVLSQISFSKETFEFLCQLTLKRRWDFFLDICEECKRVLEGKENILKGRVESSEELSLKDVKEIEKVVALFFKNKKIQLQQKRNQDLLGGIRVEIAGRSFDDSVLYHFNQFKEQMRSYGIENSSGRN